MIIIHTPRLLLRAFYVRDAEALTGIFMDPEVMRFGDGVQSYAWIHDWVAQRLASYDRNGRIGLWAVVERETEDVIGYCGLMYEPDICGVPEVSVGYRLIHRKWGYGLATEAALGVRDYGFQTLGLQRLIAIIDPANRASLRVAEKLGMTYEKEYMASGYDHPDHVYAVTRTGQREESTE